MFIDSGYVQPIDSDFFKSVIRLLVPLNLCFFAQSETKSLSTIKKIKEYNLDLNVENDVARFMVIYIQHNQTASMVELQQNDLIKNILTPLSLYGH